MKWHFLLLMVGLCGSHICKAQEQSITVPDAPRPQPAIIVGTVVDVNGDTVPGATVILQSAREGDLSHGGIERQGIF